MLQRLMQGSGRLVLVAAIGGSIGVLGCDLPDRPPRVGDDAPAFTATLLDTGEQVSLSDYRGDVLLVNIWATYCAPCRFETPYLVSVYEEYADRGFRVVGISVDSDNSLAAVKRFLEEMEVSYDILLDPDMISTDVFAAIGLPATFILDRDGVIRFMQYGPILEDDPAFLKTLDEILSREAKS
jgi:cytochrome c biogenesis protein CcmG, thiol:disulfide interchange protein DsbE